MNGLNFENNQSPKDIKIPRNTVNTTDTNRPMKGEAIKPDMPVRGWSFQVKVLNPNKLSTPIRIENGIMENRIPNECYESKDCVKRQSFYLYFTLHIFT